MKNSVAFEGKRLVDGAGDTRKKAKTILFKN